MEDYIRSQSWIKTRAHWLMRGTVLEKEKHQEQGDQLCMGPVVSTVQLQRQKELVSGIGSTFLGEGRVCLPPSLGVRPGRI